MKWATALLVYLEYSEYEMTRCENAWQ